VRQPTAWEKEAAKVTREVTRRAIRRLDVLEWVILAAAAGLAVGGGGLVAWLVAGESARAFRLTWVVTSLVLIVVPGAFAFGSIRREERLGRDDTEKRTDG
jgi:hypothetical protein